MVIKRVSLRCTVRCVVWLVTCSVLAMGAAEHEYEDASRITEQPRVKIISPSHGAVLRVSLPLSSDRLARPSMLSAVQVFISAISGVCISVVSGGLGSHVLLDQWWAVYIADGIGVLQM